MIFPFLLSILSLFNLLGEEPKPGISLQEARVRVLEELRLTEARSEALFDLKNQIDKEFEERQAALEFFRKYRESDLYGLPKSAAWLNDFTDCYTGQPCVLTVAFEPPHPNTTVTLVHLRHTLPGVDVSDLFIGKEEKEGVVFHDNLIPRETNGTEWFYTNFTQTFDSPGKVGMYHEIRGFFIREGKNETFAIDWQSHRGQIAGIFHVKEPLDFSILNKC